MLVVTIGRALALKRGGLTRLEPWKISGNFRLCPKSVVPKPPKWGARFGADTDVFLRIAIETMHRLQLDIKKPNSKSSSHTRGWTHEMLCSHADG
jgi:hypothetical protein